MSDLVSLLLAAIEAREQKARKAQGTTWDVARDGEVRELGNGGTVAYVPRPEDAEFIAGNDPAAVLRRCASDRRVLERHNKPEPMTPIQVNVWGFELRCGHCSWQCYGDGEDMVRFPCPDLADLADRYGISVEEETTGE